MNIFSKLKFIHADRCVTMALIKILCGLYSGFETDFSIRCIEGEFLAKSFPLCCVICGYIPIKRLYTIHVIIVVHVSNPPFFGMLFGVILQISVINKWFAYITSLCVRGVFEIFYILHVELRGNVFFFGVDLLEG